MPEATIDEDGDASAWEDDVGPDQAPARNSNREVAPIAEAGAMKLRAQRELRLGIPLAVALHHRRDGRRRGMWIAVRETWHVGCDTGFR